MELIVNRVNRTGLTTLGELFIDNVKQCDTLEDTDRGLKASMPIAEIKAKKIHSLTAIPAGRYEVVLFNSPHFKKLLPHLLNVPGFESILIHSGNTAADTEGCILVGKKIDNGTVADSRNTFTPLFNKIKAAIAKEKVFITIND